MTDVLRPGAWLACGWIAAGLLLAAPPGRAQDPPGDPDPPEASSEVAAEAPEPDASALASAASDGSDGCTADDCRPNFQASLFFGSAIDNFAAQDLQSYLNPDDAGQTDVFERLIGGVDFSYRMTGEPADENQLWVYGWTVHGVRSTDVDCAQNPRLFVCQQQLERPEIDDFDEQFIFALRQASSLEAALGLRYEFAELQPGAGRQGRTSARLFVAAQLGFVTVSGDDDDVLDDHLLGFGAIATNGRFQGSYLQVGYGPSDYFQVNPDNRWKLDALLSWSPERGPVSLFAEITVNVDGGPGADSIQSYFGFDLNFHELRSFLGGGGGNGGGGGGGGG